MQGNGAIDCERRSELPRYGGWDSRHGAARWVERITHPTNLRIAMGLPLTLGHAQGENTATSRFEREVDDQHVRRKGSIERDDQRDGEGVTHADGYLHKDALSESAVQARVPREGRVRRQDVDLQEVRKAVCSSVGDQSSPNSNESLRAYNASRP